MYTRRSFLRTSFAATSAVLADVSSIVGKERPLIPKSLTDDYVDGVKFVTPDAPDFATAREVYNAGILIQPKVIASCISETGVQRAVERAKVENWPIAVKAGGHSFEGFCLNDDGLVVSVSPMRRDTAGSKDGRVEGRRGLSTRSSEPVPPGQRAFLASGILQNSRSCGSHTWWRGPACSPGNGV